MRQLQPSPWCPFFTLVTILCLYYAYKCVIFYIFFLPQSTHNYKSLRKFWAKQNNIFLSNRFLARNFTSKTYFWMILYRENGAWCIINKQLAVGPQMRTKVVLMSILTPSLMKKGSYAKSGPFCNNWHDNKICIFYDYSNTLTALYACPTENWVKKGKRKG